MPELPQTLQRLVLVVDDEDLIRSLLGRILEIFGFEAVTAADGLTGLQLFEQHADTIRVVFLDLSMPGMHGSQTLTAIRQLRRDTPVIVMTGSDQGIVEPLLLDCPHTRYLAKPFTLATIESCLSELLAESTISASC